MSNFTLAGILSVGLPGDYNANDIVDAADYVCLRKTDGGNPASYNTWRVFGNLPGSGSCQCEYLRSRTGDLGAAHVCVGWLVPSL